MIKRNSKIFKAYDMDVVDLDEEKMIMDLEKGKYFSLNEMGSIIWDMINKETSASEIIESLMCDYDVDETTCESYIIEYLNALEDINLVKVSLS